MVQAIKCYSLFSSFIFRIELNWIYLYYFCIFGSGCDRKGKIMRNIAARTYFFIYFNYIAWPSLPCFFPFLLKLNTFFIKAWLIFPFFLLTHVFLYCALHCVMNCLTSDSDQFSYFFLSSSLLVESAEVSNLFEISNS